LPVSVVEDRQHGLRRCIEPAKLDDVRMGLRSKRHFDAADWSPAYPRRLGKPVPAKAERCDDHQRKRDETSENCTIDPLHQTTPLFVVIRRIRTERGAPCRCRIHTRDWLFCLNEKPALSGKALA
jgi:hypothetical protein